MHSIAKILKKVINLSEKLVKYCEGHPLALEVLGKSLRKHDNVVECEYYIKGLKKEPHSRIKKALKLSIHSLSFKIDEDLFKHIACFFVGKDRDLTEKILNACDKNTRSGIPNLIDRCLLSIGSSNTLMMHQLIQETGKDLVRQESPSKPWKRSRLWYDEDSFMVLKRKKGKGKILGLALDMRRLDKKKLCGSFELKTDSLSNMDNVMLLQLNYVQLNGCFQTFPEELRWLCMHGLSSKSIHLELPMENLVVLDMSYSSVESFGMHYSIPQPLKIKQKLVESFSKDKPLLGSLKILDMRFCEQLHSLGGFCQLPALEELLLKNCTSLSEVCESIEQCVELVHIDMSYCYKLRKLPISLGKLKKVKTLLLDGCNFQEYRIEMCDTNSSDAVINSQTSSYANMEDIPSDLKFFATSLPSSLIKLSLANNNLSNKSFPDDFSGLSMLEELCLDKNPLVSMPNCVRTLPRIKQLSMENCDMVISIEHPPRTLKLLSIKSYSSSLRDYKNSLRKVTFDPDMYPLNLLGASRLLSPSSFKIEGMVNIQPMASVEENVLHRLGWNDLNFTKERSLGMYTSKGSEASQTQIYYEFGIFSAIYEGKGMPNWIRRRSKGPSISFTIPSSPKKIRGLNFCCMETHRFSYRTHSTIPTFFVLPMIKISNITKNYTWNYDHYIERVKLRGTYLTFLSHWMFGPNEMKGGDEISISVIERTNEPHSQYTKNCGLRLVYDDENIEEEDVLGYYKSWNHIIGGDLSSFQLITGEYILDNDRFSRYTNRSGSRCPPFTNAIPSFKEDRVGFRAFS